MPDVSRPAPSRGRWVVVYVLLAPAVLLPLWVSLYDRTDPTLFGFPFYFWFQFALILLAVALTLPAFFIAKGADRGDRVRHGLPPDPPAEPAGEPTDSRGGRR
jgi:hypothetical protein